MTWNLNSSMLKLRLTFQDMSWKGPFKRLTTPEVFLTAKNLKGVHFVLLIANPILNLSPANLFAYPIKVQTSELFKTKIYCLTNIFINLYCIICVNVQSRARLLVKMKQRRFNTVPLWKYMLVNIYLVLALALTIAYILLCVNFLKAAKGELFEQDGLNCSVHLNTKYCCGTKSYNILSTNLSTSKQINWTYSPNCHKIEVHINPRPIFSNQLN